MPYIEGESLRARLERQQSLPLEEAVRIALEVGDALSYAHAHGIIHRDIKPENILLSGAHAWVADFGIARAISAAGGHTLTGGHPVGSLAYMSPEQLMGSRAIDARTDVYSLGGVLEGGAGWRNGRRPRHRWRAAPREPRSTARPEARGRHGVRRPLGGLSPRSTRPHRHRLGHPGTDTPTRGRGRARCGHEPSRRRSHSSPGRPDRGRHRGPGNVLP